MLGKKGKARSTQNFETLLSGKAEVVGDVHFSGGLHIDGVVKGNVIAKDDPKTVVRVSDRGLVEGEIRAPNVIINGTVKGNVYSSEHVELAAKAVVTGNVYYKLMEMVMGAQVNGQLMHHDDAGVQSLIEPEEEATPIISQVNAGNS